MRNFQCLATSQSAAMPPYFSRTKALSCQKSAHLEPKREASLFSLPPPLLCDPIFLLCWLGGEKGIFILVSLLEVKVPWDVESEETLPCFPSLVFFNPSQQSLWDSKQRISSSMRSGSELHGGGGAELRDHTACGGPCRHAIPRMMRRQACEHMCCCR